MSGFKNINKEKILNISELIDYRKNKVISLTLCDTDDIRIVLFSFDKEEAITEEQTPNTENYTIIEGEIEFNLEGKNFILKENQSIIIKPEIEHSLTALKQSKILQTSIK